MLIKFENGGEFLATSLTEDGEKWLTIRQKTDLGTETQVYLNLETAIELYNELGNYIEQFEEEENDSEIQETQP